MYRIQSSQVNDPYIMRDNQSNRSSAGTNLVYNKWTSLVVDSVQIMVILAVLISGR